MAETQDTQQQMALVGVRRCGCITAAMVEDYASKKDVRDFYRDMADTDREVRRMSVEETRAHPLFLVDCPHGVES